MPVNSDSTIKIGSSDNFDRIINIYPSDDSDSRPEIDYRENLGCIREIVQAIFLVEVGSSYNDYIIIKKRLQRQF